MSERVNRRWLLAERPTGMCEARHFRWVEEAVPELEADGEILVRNLYLSLDPTQRGWLARDTYLPAVAIGEVVRSGAVGRVEQSRNPHFAVGELVNGMFGWQDFARVMATKGQTPTKLPPGVPIPLAMSVLGLTGITAYFGLLDVGRPKAGETVVVSGAAGATGSVVGRRSRASRDVERSASRVAKRSATGSSATPTSTRPSITNPRTCTRAWASFARTASTCTSTTWGATSSTWPSAVWRCEGAS